MDVVATCFHNGRDGAGAIQKCTSFHLQMWVKILWVQNGLDRKGHHVLWYARSEPHPDLGRAGVQHILRLTKALAL